MISSKRKIYLTLLVFAAACILLIGFGVSPFLSKLKASTYDLALKEATLKLLQNQLLSSRQFQENYPLLEQDLNKIKAGFVDSEAPIDFIEFLELEAQKAELEMVISPFSSLLAGSGPWLSTGFRVSLGGSFPDCLRFLERIEQSPWLIEIERLNVERISKGAQAPREFKNLKKGDVSFILLLKAFSGRVLSENEK